MRKIFTLIALQMQTLVMFALFLLLIYMPYQHTDVNLFPFEINVIFWRSAWYYIVLFFLIYIFVCVRLSLLSSIRNKIPLRTLLYSDSILGLLFLPCFFFSNIRFLTPLMLFFALLLIAIDYYKYQCGVKIRFLYIFVILFFFTNIILVFVNWQNNQNRLLKATELVEYCRTHDDWKHDTHEWTIAKYVDSELVKKSGYFDYPIYFDFDVDHDGLNYVTMRSQSEHYIYQYSEVIYVVSRQSWVPWFRYFVNFTYLFTFYLFIAFICYYFTFIFRRKRSPRPFFMRLQSTLISFLLSCMLFVFVIASILILNRHRGTACQNEKQRMGFMVESLRDIVRIADNQCDSLFFADITKKANIFQSDISVYDKDGIRRFTTNPQTKHVKHYSDWNLSPFYNMEASIYASINNDNEMIGSYAVVINCAGEPIYLQMSSDLEVRKLERNITLFFVLVFNLYFIVIFISLLLSFFISRRISAPLSIIENNMRNLVVGEKNAKINYPISEGDALSQLIAQYNLMVEKLDVSVVELAQNEREESWRQMARQMAHEIKNPLTPMKLLAQRMMMLNSDDIEEYKQSVQSLTKSLLQGIESITNTTNALSNFAKQPILPLETINIVERVRYIVDLFQNNEENVVIYFTTKIDDAKVLVDREMIGHVFNNLLRNAIQAIPEDKQGEISVKIYCVNTDVIVSVTDNGVGISEENKDKLFNVNFTTKTKGMGLGLIVVKNVIDQAGGKITFHSVEGEGSTFIVSLPLKC